MMSYSDDVIIRSMVKSDLDAIMDIETASFAIPWSRNSFEVELEKA